jgi:outer membrane protein assembly factor BamB
MFRATTEGPIGTALAISGNVVFVTGGDQVVRALDGPTLRELWEVDLGRGTLSAPSVKAGRLFVGTSLGEVFAIGSPPAGP